MESPICVAKTSDLESLTRIVSRETLSTIEKASESLGCQKALMLKDEGQRRVCPTIAKWVSEAVATVALDRTLEQGIVSRETQLLMKGLRSTRYRLRALMPEHTFSSLSHCFT